MSKIGKIVKIKSGEESPVMAQSQNPVLPLQALVDIPQKKTEIPQGTDYWGIPLPNFYKKKKANKVARHNRNHDSRKRR